MRKKHIYLFVILTILISFNSFAQINDDYEFLNLTSSARIASMGGDFLAVNDNDITLAVTNPSIINREMNNHLGVAFVDYYSGINYGFAAYSRTFKKAGSFVASMNYRSFGEFDYADVTGERAGKFHAGQSALGIGWGRSLDSIFSIGSTVKFIYSSFETYTSYGLAVDVAGSYTSRNRSFVMSLIAKNIGRQLKAYNGGNIGSLPFEIQFGISKKVLHGPFRISILYDHLEKWDLRYDDPLKRQTDPITGEVVKNSNIENIADNLMRHIVVGGEIIFSKNFSLRGGYFYKRREELKVDSKPGTIGFSWGFEFRVSKFRFSYARSAYHLAGSPNFITITTNLSDFSKNRN